MKILISSLQVSHGSSKGHLHPAIEIALALNQRGHEVALLPLPCNFSASDLAQINRCEIKVITPPPLPAGLPLSAEQLGKLVKSVETTHLAFESFLVSPLQHQFSSILRTISEFNPDIVVYDLLVYAAPLAARILNIKDVGYCAGLKLIAPASLTGIYQTTAAKLAPQISGFLKEINVSADFHQLELLSTTHQMVFAADEFIGARNHPDPAGTILMGPLPVSMLRTVIPDQNLLIKAQGAVVVCFGSVFDPANYPRITEIIIKVTRQFGRHLIIASEKLSNIHSEDITVTPYLPLPDLMTHAAILIHHGGANTFSEALALGARQILIPLATDQPIQGEYLRHCQSGITIHPEEITEEILQDAFRQLLDPDNEIHHHIRKNRMLYQNGNGAKNAAILIEKTAQQD